MEEVKKGLYISNLPQHLKSGGWSGMNINIYEQLNKHFDIEYLSPINPPVLKSEQIKSKLKSIITKKRDLEFYSEKRLSCIAGQFKKQLKSNADFLFFHGTTPWIKYELQLPYYSYVDATFLTYLDIYLNSNNYSQKEILRITGQESSFLKKASGIFFSSEWARQESINRYMLTGENMYSVGLGGNIEPHLSITITQEIKLLFVSMDFKCKGGDIAFETFKTLLLEYPTLSLDIIGDTPPEHIINYHNVNYHGFINKNTKEGVQKFKAIFKQATFLIHPTEKDMTPLIIVEAGYFGIPTIAPNKFGIPEMIVDNKTGFFVQENTYSSYVTKLSSIFNKPDDLCNMRNNCYEFMTTNYIWDKVGERITKVINETI